jgi:hypothetical protein
MTYRDAGFIIFIIGLIVVSLTFTKKREPQHATQKLICDECVNAFPARVGWPIAEQNLCDECLEAHVYRNEQWRRNA